MALKDFALSLDQCHNPYCDFESGTCGWSWSGPADEFKCYYAGYSHLPLRIDHTSSAVLGHVLSMSREAATATLQGPMIEGRFGYQCFTFWMLKSKDKIDIELIRYDANRKEEFSVWKSPVTSGGLADAWVRVQNTVNLVGKNQLRIKIHKAGAIAVPFGILALTGLFYSEKCTAGIRRHQSHSRRLSAANFV